MMSNQGIWVKRFCQPGAVFRQSFSRKLGKRINRGRKRGIPFRIILEFKQQPFSHPILFRFGQLLGFIERSFEQFRHHKNQLRFSYAIRLYW
jgi:hypothetical protein